MGNHWSKALIIFSLITIPDLKKMFSLYTASRIENLIDLNATQIVVLTFALFFQK